MSRSYKKHPICKGSHPRLRQMAKRQSNKQLRNQPDFSTFGNGYRKEYYPKFFLYEFRFYEERNHRLHRWKHRQPSWVAQRFDTVEECMNGWARWYYRK